MKKIVQFPLDKRRQQQIIDLEERVYLLEETVRKLQMWRLADVKTMLKITNKEVKK